MIARGSEAEKGNANKIAKGSRYGPRDTSFGRCRVRAMHRTNLATD